MLFSICIIEIVTKIDKKRPEWAHFFKEWAAVVVAQLVERSLPATEVCSSNPVIGRFYYCQLNVNAVLKRIKEAENGTFF